MLIEKKSEGTRGTIYIYLQYTAARKRKAMHACPARGLLIYQLVYFLLAGSAQMRGCPAVGTNALECLLRAVATLGRVFDTVLTGH